MNSSKSSFVFQFLYIFKKLFSYYKKVLLVYISLIIITGLLPQLDAFITGKLIDHILTQLNIGGSTTQALPMLILVVTMFFLMRIIYDYQSYISQLFNLELQNFTDKLQFEKLVDLPPHAYEDSEFIALKNIISYNIWKIGNIFFWVISILGAIITNTLVIIVFFSYSPIILISALVSIIFPSIVRLLFGKQVWGIWDSLSDIKIIYGLYRNPLYVDDASKFVETKVFGYGPYLLNKFLNINMSFLKDLITNEKKRFFFMIVARLFEYAFVGIGLWYIFNSVITGTVSVGVLYFLLTIYWSLRNSTSFTLEQVTDVMADAPFVKSLYEFLTYIPKYNVTSGTTVLENIAPEIEFRDVWFKYPDTDSWVLKGVTFKIDRKTDIAFVGKNGAGKTTLIKLILRVYDVTSGEILINGVNIKDISLTDYYKSIGILSQNFHSFGFSAQENISIGDISRADNIKENVIVAAKKAQADTFINKYENNYDTYLTRELSGGIKPSGGQLQRIAIARVFYKNPIFIILDEPTSAIDSLAEEKIFTTIKKESKDKTVIIISHRFATVKKANYIYVLEDGVIKEQGTHGELCDIKGLYLQMYTAQQS